MKEVGTLLQKILVVLVGLIMSVVGALSPDGLVASRNQGDADVTLSGNVAEETLATLRTTDGQAFARISVLWVEVDGRRVAEDAWGTGEVEEIRFKVGVKGVDDAALAVGSRIVELHPTDVITVRMFRGDFSYRGLGTPIATLQLQGTVKTTVLREGDLDNRVLTQLDGKLQDAPASRAEEERVAYVVLTTGQKLDTVAVEDGGSRLYTEEASSVADAKDEPGNLLAKWVKIDGRLVQEYTWGDGSLGKVEFEPAEAVSRSVVLAFNGEAFEVPAGERVVVEDFVGEYLVYQVSGGLVRLRLDGYASVYATAPALPVPQQGGEGAPLVSFDFLPVSPRTTDTVQFRDASNDDGGIIVFRHWDFGDNTSGVVEHPTHRYERPGTYHVKLTVTDNDLKSSNITRPIVVRNAEPVADFDFSPHVVTTGTLVSFSDQSYDSDGALASWSWDFGDGSTSTLRHPTHRFTRGGSATVTLTVTDDMGDRTSLSKVVIVRNTPPLASFTYSPGNPLTLDGVQFVSNSTDSDGTIASWNWSFGDGNYGSGSAPVHKFARPGLYTVSLTVTDDGGDSDTASTTLTVGNRPPFAEFLWNPEAKPADIPVQFTSQATDPDGVILTWRWDWGDGSAESLGAQASHTFAAAGTYNVTLTVTDNTLGVANVTRTVVVANAAPRPNMVIAPNPTYRGLPVTFSDASIDIDGDSIVSAVWDLGPGRAREGRVVTHTFDEVGEHPIRLTVTDDEGNEASVTRTLRVLNRPPVVTADLSPRRPAAGEPVLFTSQAVDLDRPDTAVNVSWTFSDGVVRHGPDVERTFSRHGNYSVTARATDSEGAVSAGHVLSFYVGYASPVVDFTWTPTMPAPGEMANFTDLSTSLNGAIREWRWNFGDDRQDSLSGHAAPSHVFRTNGTLTVRLDVVDVVGQPGFAEKTLLVNLAPVADILPPVGVLRLNTPITFLDNSSDLDGTIVNWTWSFSDGRVAYERSPTHPGFQSPGEQRARLVVTDDRGATNATVLRLDIANTAPVARWSHAPTQPVRGQPVSFAGAEHSFDPDGTPISSYEWTFDDGTAPLSGPQFGNASHTFLHSGRYAVGLKVSDGGGTSLRTPESHKDIDVLPSHGVRVNVRGYLPGKVPAPITLAPYTLTVRVGSSVVGADRFFPDGNVMGVEIDQSLWVDRDVLNVRIQAPFLSGANEVRLRLQDGVPVVNVTIPLRMEVRAAIEPAAGNSLSLLALLGVDGDHRGDPLYSDMLEKPHGTGVVTYADASPVKRQRVHVEARWVPLRALADTRNVSDAPEASGLLPNFCKMGEFTTDDEGAFNWTFDGRSPCYTNAVANGVYPVGRWEVRARPLVPDGENRVSPIRVFYVDPTGGRLLAATVGLA